MKKLNFVLAVVAVLVVAALIWGDGSDLDAGDGRGAERKCEELVKAQLKAPATADFSDVAAVGDGPWDVSATVDSENSFGATLRSKWTCRIEHVAGSVYDGTAVLVG